jgi:tetratricopeptide (TPR) repeat protein
MPKKIPRKRISKIILTISFFLFFCTSLSIAQDNTDNNAKPPELTDLQQQARDYRDQGLKLQDLGDLDAAMKLYQKAAELDPSYAVVYNDLGVIYEMKGMLDRAEASYLQAIRVDPYYLSTYSNLALYYENERELGKALYCWKKRLELGDLNDPWTLKAKQRVEDIRMALSQRPTQDAQEREVVSLMKDVTTEKYVVRHDPKAFARKKMEQARISYGKENYAAAIKEALDAQYLDPDNKEIEEFIEKTQSRALSR